MSGSLTTGAWKNGKSVICAARGTVWDIRDIMEDLDIAALSCPPCRWAQFEKFVKNIFEQNPRLERRFLTGHSLGGCVALKAGMGLDLSYGQGLRIHAFNPGASLLDPVVHEMTTACFGNARATVHRIKNDLVSQCCARFRCIDVIEYNQTKRGAAHAMHQFL